MLLPLAEPLQFLDALNHVELRGVIKDSQRGPDFIAGLSAGQVAVQGFDSLARGLLQPPDSGLHDTAPGLAVRGLKFGEL